MKIYKGMSDKIKLVREPSEIHKAKIMKSEDAKDYVLQLYQEDLSIYESFYILLMNRQNSVDGWYQLSKGGINGTVIDVRIICKIALDCFASSVILVHNHPSGNKKPSESDRAITMKIANALTILDIKVLDHVIITTNGHYSFADNGEL